MPQATREIKRRIKSISSTKKITRAMELVAANKMRKATSQVLATRTYADRAWEMLQRIAERTLDYEHPLLEHREKIEKIGLVLLSSNRGLCGSFNTNIVNLTLDYIEFYQGHKVHVEVICQGKKGTEAMRRAGHSIKAEFEKLDVTSNIQEIRALAKMVIDDYLNGDYDKVMLAYTDYISTLLQKPRIKQLLPLVGKDEYLGKVEATIRQEENVTSRPGSEKWRDNERNLAFIEYLFEPSPQEVLDELLPRLVEMQIYQAVLESDGSEHSARMVAMRNATEAAGDMIYDLTLMFNQARQASITQEIAEIATAKVAIEQ